MKRSLVFHWIIVAILILSVQGCGAEKPVITATPTVTQTFTLTGTPTRTPTPSKTPRPSKTPNLKLTESYDDLFTWVQKFKDDGIIPETFGKYVAFDPYDMDVAQMGWLQYVYFDTVRVKNFVYSGHIRWSTSIDTNKTSGCGIIFALELKEKQNNYFGVILDKSRVYFSAIDSGYYYDLGKTKGTGKLDFGNPAEADLTFLAYEHKAYVYVNDDFIGEYTLPPKKELRGYFGYGIISGTNHDYGTKCSITNSRLWDLSK